MNNIFIVILHFGGVEPVKKCISSIVKETNISSEQIIVVDNAGKLKNIHWDIELKIIRNRKNLGYAGGMNKGIALALSKGAEYVLLLNNDTLIEMSFINELKEYLKKHKRVGITSPAIRFRRKGKILYDLGGRINNVFGKTSHNEVNSILDKNPCKVDYVSGCCMFIKRAVFEKVGLFDERFFLYYEDVDFCLRAKNVGLETFVLPNRYVYHALSQTVGKDSSVAIYHQTISALLFGKKHFRAAKRFLHMLFIFIQSSYLLLKNPIQGRRAFLGFYHGIR